MSASATLDPTLTVEIGFGIDPSDTGYLVIGDSSRGLIGTGKIGPSTIWTDVTAYLRGFSYDIGRDRASDSWKAGTCSLEFNNEDGRFDPANLSGPYVSGGVSQVGPMRAVRIRSTFGGTTYTRFIGYTDDVVLHYSEGNTFATATFPCTDGSKVLANVEPSAVAEIGAGELTGARIGRILTAASWPTADRDIDTGTETVQATTLSQGPMTEMETVALSEGGIVGMSADGKVFFRSRTSRLTNSRSNTAVDSFDDGDYTDIVPANDADLVLNDIRYTSPGAAGITQSGTMTFRPSATAVSADVTGTPDASNLYNDVNGAVYSASNYVQNVALSYGTYGAYVGVPAGLLTGATIESVRVFAVTNLASGSTGVLNVVVGSSTSGAVATSSGASSTISATFAVNPSTGAAWTVAAIEAFASTSYIKCAASRVQTSAGDYKLYQLWMEVDYTNLGAVGGVEQTAADSTSQTRYLKRTESRSDLILQTDAATARIAAWRLWTRKNHEQRFESVTFKPAGDAAGALWPRVLPLQFFDRITLSNTPPSGITSSGDYFVIGISEACSMQSREPWTVRLSLEPATPYDGFLVIGDATLGKVGTGKIA